MRFGIHGLLARGGCLWGDYRSFIEVAVNLASAHGDLCRLLGTDKLAGKSCIEWV